ncbi:hypothetical protein QBC45DRAFT_137967 [Copromyces sp. CBS 386.78]|nr:hypothetical protein QBC45DRAFT_137967 [Copromyces sp. CBS 386.78]
MPPKAAAAEGPAALRGQSLTPAESRLLYAVLENLNSPIDANWEKAAAAAGLKDPKSCKEMWRRFRVKYAVGADSADAGDGATPVKKRARGRPPKNAAALSTPGTSAMAKLSVDDGIAPKTPSKSLSALGIKRSAAEAAADEEDTPAKKRAAARQPRLTARQKAAAAAAAQAEAGDSNRDSVDVAMERVSSAIADMHAAAEAGDGYATASEGGGADLGEI